MRHKCVCDWGRVGSVTRFPIDYGRAQVTNEVDLFAIQNEICICQFLNLPVLTAADLFDQGSCVHLVALSGPVVDSKIFQFIKEKSQVGLPGDTSAAAPTAALTRSLVYLAVPSELHELGALGKLSCHSAFPPILHPSRVMVLTKVFPVEESVSLPSFTKITCKGCLRAKIRAYAGRVDRWRRIDVRPAVRGIVHSASAPVEAEVIHDSANQHMESQDLSAALTRLPRDSDGCLHVS